MEEHKPRLRIERIIFCIIIVTCLIFLIKYLASNKKEKQIDTTNKEANVQEEVLDDDVIKVIFDNDEEEISELSLIMVGDYLIHNSVYQDATRYTNNNGYDFKPMLTYIKDRVQNFDLAYYNQETILGGAEIGVSTYPNFNSPYEAGDAMLDAGFNLVSLATNHTMDRGITAVLNSRRYWDLKENVLAVGSYDSKEKQDGIYIKEKNGIKYTMLNYTYGTNDIPVTNDYLVNVWPVDENIGSPENDTNYQEYKEKVRKDVEDVRDKVDVLIVAMHWGEEYSHTPNAYQKDQAHFLADLGVNIIIGTHPHVIQPVEWIGDTLVFYSLGNFISAQRQDSNYNKVIGLMSSLNIKKFLKEKM